MNPAGSHATPVRHRLRHRDPPLDVWVAGTGPPVVLLHGWGLSGRAYRGAMRALALRGRRVLAPSLAVTGERWSLRGVATLAAEAMAALDVARAPVVGHSFGAAVAVRLAVDQPESVSALVLVEPVGISPGVRRLARIVLPGRQWRVAANAPTARALLRTVATRGAWDSLGGAARWILVNGLEEELATLGDWATPSSVLWAEDESLLPRSVGDRVAGLLGCRLTIVGAGDGWPDRRPPDHDWPLRAPGFFAERIILELSGLIPPEPGSTA